MRYLRKYIDNFWFVNRVLFLTLKCNFHIVFLSAKNISKIISVHNSNCNILNSNLLFADFRRIDKRIDKIIDVLPFQRTCLLRALIKTDYLRRYAGYYVPINLGVTINDNLLSAHSWIEKEGGYCKCNTFIKVN